MTVTEASLAATAGSAAPADRPSAQYPFLVSVRGSPPAPARKEDGYFWLRHEMHLGIVWGPRDVTVLETCAPAGGER
jgi:hypothetical protein